jgi:hypothetical protein
MPTRPIPTRPLRPPVLPSVVTPPLGRPAVHERDDGVAPGSCSWPLPCALTFSSSALAWASSRVAYSPVSRLGPSASLKGGRTPSTWTLISSSSSAGSRCLERGTARLPHRQSLCATGSISRICGSFCKPWCRCSLAGAGSSESPAKCAPIRGNNIVSRTTTGGVRPPEPSACFHPRAARHGIGSSRRHAARALSQRPGARTGAGCR